jgi:hypothetical protein
MTQGQLDQVVALLAPSSGSDAIGGLADEIRACGRDPARAVEPVQRLLSTVGELTALGQALRGVFGLATNQSVSGI